MENDIEFSKIIEKIRKEHKKIIIVTEFEKNEVQEHRKKMARERKIQALIDGKGSKKNQKRFNACLDAKKLEDKKQKAAIKKAAANVTTIPIPIVKEDKSDPRD